MSPEYVAAREAFVFLQGKEALKHPWKQGELLSTTQTRRWTAEEQRLAHAKEQLCAFACFKGNDAGRSRLFVYKFESAEVCQRVVAEHHHWLQQTAQKEE